MTRSFFAFIVTALILVSCAPTTRTVGSSFTDPGFKPGSVHSMLVQVKTDDLGERQALEGSAVAALTSSGISAGRSIDLLPPTRDIGDAASKRKIMNSGTDAVLVITPKQKKVVEEYIPPSYYPGHRRYSRYHSGYGDFYNVPGVIDGGYFIREPVATYDVALYALPHYRTLWTGQFTIRGSTGADFNALAGRFGPELVKRMGADGLLGP